MADEADMADGYAERIVEESLRLLQQRKNVETWCTFCEEFETETLPNGVRSMFCTRCRLEKEAEIQSHVLPVSIVHLQGDGEEDSWMETMLPSNKYRRRWFI